MNVTKNNKILRPVNEKKTMKSNQKRFNKLEAIFFKKINNLKQIELKAAIDEYYSFNQQQKIDYMEKMVGRWQ